MFRDKQTRRREREKVDRLTERRIKTDTTQTRQGGKKARKSGRCRVKETAIVSHVSVNLF